MAEPTDYASAAGHICATIARACTLGHSGDTVIVRDGTYASGDNDISDCADNHQNYASNVVFKPEPGHECPLTYPGIPAEFASITCDVNLVNPSVEGNALVFNGSVNNTTCGVSSGHPLPSTLPTSDFSGWTTHLTFEGMYIGAFHASCSAHMKFLNDVGTFFYERQGTYDWLIQGGDFSLHAADPAGEQPTLGDAVSPSSPFPPLEKVTAEDLIIRDFTSSSAHGDGWFIQPAYDVHIIKNIIVRNDCIPFYVNFSQGGDGTGQHGLWVIGNAIHVSEQHVVGEALCPNVVNLGEISQQDDIIAFNSVEGNLLRHDPTSGATVSNNRIVGNVIGELTTDEGGGCEPGFTASYNVFYWSGASTNGCGADSSTNSTLSSGTQQFTSYDTASWTGTPSDSIYHVTNPGNYQLQAGVAAVAKVPVSWCSTDSDTQAVCDALTTDIDGVPRPNPSHSSYYDAGAFENR